MTDRSTTRQILAQLDAGLRAAPDNPTERRLARELAKALTEVLPDRDMETVGEAMLHVVTHAAATARALHSKGLDDETILAAVLNVIGIAGAELYARGTAAVEADPDGARRG